MSMDEIQWRQKTGRVSLLASDTSAAFCRVLRCFPADLEVDILKV